MDHLDEGTVHAWLDGALSPDEGERIEEHVASCAECSALVAEARGLIAASSRILSALDEVPRVGANAAPTPPRASDLTLSHGEAALAPKTAPRRKAWWMRPQLSAAAVLTIVAVSSLFVARNRESTIPASLKAPAAASAPSEAPASPVAPLSAPIAESAPASKSAAGVAADAASLQSSANARRSPSDQSQRAVGATTDARAARAQGVAPLQLRTNSTSSPNDAKKDVARDALGRTREVAASAQGGANAVVAAPAVAPPPAAAKAVLDSTAATLARTEGAMKRKEAPVAPPARTVADAAAPRADTTGRSDQPQKVTRALDPNRRAQIEKERIQNEPKIENVVVTGAASALRFSPVRSTDVIGCWSIQRSAAARASDIPQRVELTARVVGRENGVEVRAAQALDVKTSPAVEWRWMIGQHGDVTLIQVANGVQSTFPLLTSPDHRADAGSKATREECGAR